jgi:hypothetical protein
MRGIRCVGVVIGVLTLGASSAVASSGPPTPAGCTFSNGTTVCSNTTVSTSTFTQEVNVDGQTCTQLYEQTVRLTTFTAHKGAPGSQGAAVTAPPGFGSVTVAPVGPPDCPSPLSG